jgi:hypothetical protein
MTFRLAPMSTDLRVLTVLLLALPVLFLLPATSAPWPVTSALGATGALLVLAYASVWFLFRPTRFEVDADALRIVWPLRQRAIARTDVEDARILGSAEFRRDHGLGVRIGAGGLWGGFGLLKTRQTTFSMWISRTDRFVIVRLRGARPLLLTPDDPERFVAALGR